MKKSITNGVNIAISRKLVREANLASQADSRKATDDAEYVRKRRHAEDVALARDLGITIEELVK